MNSIERIKKAIKREKCNEVPVGFCDQEFAVKLSDIKYSDYVSNGEKMAEALLNVADKYDVDWLWVHGDDWIEVEKLGHKIEMMEFNSPTIKEYPFIKSKKDINKLEVPNPLKNGRMKVRLEAIQILSKKIGKDKMICGHICAPFSMALLIGGIEDCLVYIHKNPAILKDLIEFSFENGINYAQAQIRAGAHAIWVGDVLSSSWLISLEHYIEWALQFEKKIIERIKAYGGITFLQLAENNSKRFSKMIEAEPDILNIGPEADIKDVLNVVGGKNVYTVD